MQDIPTKVRWVEYNRLNPKSLAPREQTVRVFRHSPERIQLQLRNKLHYMTATLNLFEAKEIIAALAEGIEEIKS